MTFNLWSSKAAHQAKEKSLHVATPTPEEGRGVAGEGGVGGGRVRLWKWEGRG